MGFVERVISSVKNALSGFSYEPARLPVLVIFLLVFFQQLFAFNPQQFSNMQNADISLLFSIIVASLAVLIVQFAILVASAYFYTRLTVVALSKDLQVRPWNFVIFLKVLIQAFLVFLAAAFSVFELKFLLLLIAGIALFLVALLTAPLTAGLVLLVLMALASLLLLLYALVVVRNFIRLAFTSFIYLTRPVGVIESLRVTWSETSGKAVKIFAYSAVVSIPISVAYAILLLILGIVTSAVDSVLNLQLAGFQLLPIFAFASMLVIGAFTVFNIFYSVEIFKLLILKQQTASQTQQMQVKIEFKKEDKLARKTTKRPAAKNA